jgi:hypothetical protein
VAADANVVKMEQREHKILDDGLNPGDVTEDFGHRTSLRFCKGIPADLPVEQWTDARLWRKAARTIHIYDRIVCVDAGLQTWAELLVEDKVADDLRLSILRHKKLAPRKRNVLTRELAEDFDVAIGIDGYRARKKSDGSWVGQWQKLEENAVRDIIEYSRRHKAA